MRKFMLILGMLMLMAMPAAAETGEGDPLMGAVKFGEHNARTELIWKSGIIRDIDETGIRVGDLGYGFVPETKFYSADGTLITRMNFHKGTRVKFVLKRDPVTYYLVTIVSLVKD